MLFIIFKEYKLLKVQKGKLTSETYKNKINVHIYIYTYFGKEKKEKVNNR